MPQGHARYRTHVRVADLGAAGYIHPHRVLELMQEAAAHASTEAGYLPERYRQMGASWFIREVCLTMDGVVAYGEDVEVETWISAIRRFRSTREYILRVGGKTVARGNAEWLLLEQGADRKVRPRLPDAALLAAFPTGQGVALSSDELPSYAEPTPESGPAHEDHRVVRPTEIDQHGHVNHVRYLAWLDDHGQRVRPNERLVLVRMTYLLDALVHDDLELRWHDGPDGHLQFIYRGDQRLVRAVVRRIACRG